MPVERTTLKDATVGALTRAWASSPALVLLFSSFWVIQAVNSFVFDEALTGWGIRPHDPAGLVGILFAPVLHGGFVHLAFNTFFGFPLAVATLERSRGWFWPITFVTAVTAGVGTWFFGAPGSVHIGFSGVLFGYLGFLTAQLIRGLGLRGKDALGALPYSALLLSFLPGISWQGHLFGFLGGAVLGAVLTPKGSIRRVVRRARPGATRVG